MKHIARMILLGTVIASVVLATPIIGTFSIAGEQSVRVGDVWGGGGVITNSYIDWGSNVTTTPPVPNTFNVPVTPIGADPTLANGGFNISVCLAACGYFTGIGATPPPVTVPPSLTPGHGMIRDLLQSTAPVGGAGVPFAAGDNFLSGFGAPFNGLDFVLTYIFPSLAPDFAHPNSPFTITPGSGGGSVISMSVRGTVTNTITGDFGLWEGIFTAQDNRSNADLLTALLTNGAVDVSWSGTITAADITIPEPATTSMMLLGGALLGAAGLLKKLRLKK